MPSQYQKQNNYANFIKQYGPFHPLLHNSDVISDEEHCIAEYFGVFIVDRTHKFEPSKQYKIAEPVPEGFTNCSFEECVDQQAYYIAENFKDRHIVLMWSGGLDSTTAFYGLIKTGIQIHMHINHHAISEFPLLAAQILSGQFENVTAEYVYTGFMGMPHPKWEFDFNDYIEKHPDILVITGEIGDQIFGSAVSYSRSYNTRQKPYREVVPKEVVELLDPTVLNFLNKPYDKITFSEWTWAVNFTCKYQDVLMRMGSQWGLLPVEPYYNCVHFYNNPNFQRWAMQNYQSNCDYQEKHQYKQKMRDYLLQEGCDEKYCNTKWKMGSLCRVAYK